MGWYGTSENVASIVSKNRRAHHTRIIQTI